MKVFANKYTISSHTIALVWFFLVTAWDTYPAFSTFGTAVYAHLPNLAQLGLKAAVALIGPAIVYFTGQQPPAPPAPPAA